MASFVHLHVHSYYSLLDGCSSPEQIARAAAQAGMPGLALTDHDALYGAIEFYTACQDAGIQPVLGMELTLDLDHEVPGAGPDTPTIREDRHSDDGYREVGHADSLVLLAQDLEGYGNLCRLTSALQTRPEREAALRRGLPLSELEGRTGGLLVLSGGKRGLLDRLLRTGRTADAEALARAWAGRFGVDRFYVELQLQDPGDLRVAASLEDLAQRLGLETVCTNNVHYVAPAAAGQCRLLSAMNELTPLDQTPHRQGLHLASAAEMSALFAAFPRAVANTCTIAERCALELPLGMPVFPAISLPQGQTAGDLLRHQALIGAERCYSVVDQAVRSRLDHELDIIDRMGYAPLFLIVADIVTYARERGVPVNLRGSAASSLVAYCLGISPVDPIALDLYFERFLNPERRDPPDIDLDLCSRRREEVVRYIYRRYGEDRVATICTYARLRARSAWREVAKAYRLPQVRIERIAKEIPRFFHPGMWSEIEESKERLLSAAENEREREALAAAWDLDGHPRHLSVHPGGVVIAPVPLTDLVPLQLAAKGVTITQYDLHSIERLGLVKIDLLGIRALTVVAESIELVQRRCPGFSRQTIPDGDRHTGDLLERADTIGCFQTESPGMRRTLFELGARTVEDVTVSLALYKPGPLQGGLKDAFVRRHKGQEPTRYLHSSLEPVLRRTYGVVLYQEQVLRIVHELAGFTLGEADRFRRAIGHLGRGDEMLPMQHEFVRRVEQVSGIPAMIAERLWEMLFSFAGYGFLKAHAASYAAVAYQTAYLKAHHPAEFMTAVLRNWGGYYPQRVYLGEARRRGLDLRPPHVNHSGRRFELEYGPDSRAVLWMGLDQVRELTRKTIAAVLEARKERPFRSLADLIHRVRPRSAETENLIRAGALDGLGSGRKALLSELRDRPAGSPLQMALPLSWSTGPVEDDFELAEKLALEMAILGWPVSAHPLEPFAEQLEAAGAISSEELAARAGEPVLVAGARMSLWGERRGRVWLEDQAGTFAVRLPAERRLSPGTLGKLGPYLVQGHVQAGRGLEMSIQAQRVKPL